MKKLLYLGLLSVCVLLGSCVEKNVSNVFDKVERYMDVYSDSALLLLEQIPHPEKLRGKQRADYVLLLTQARDKNYLDSMQSDSLIKLKREYFLLYLMIVGFNSLTQTVGAIFVCKVCYHRDTLVRPSPLILRRCNL